jgi:protein involved in polysaccharide export with SLBB domain
MAYITHSKKRFIPAAAILFIVIFSQAFSQIDYYNITGAKEDDKDTLAYETARAISKETTGLLEREIDPAEYLLGPRDEIAISIMTSKPIVISEKISAEGKLVIEGVGIADLKGKTLEQAYGIIKNKIRKVYKTEEVFIALKDLREFKVSVSGAVPKPIIVPATAVDRVSEVIDRAGGLKFDGSLRNITLKREKNNEVVKVDLLRFYLLGEDDANPCVLGGDHIIVPPNSEKQSIEVFGEVYNPSQFEYVEGDSLSTVIRFCQGFLPSAFLDSVEIVRMTEQGILLEHISLDLSSWKGRLDNGGAELANDMKLQIGDRIYVRERRNWKKTKYAVIKGEVVYPGKYAIDERSTRVRDLIFRAGGFTDDASLEASEFIRQEEINKRDEEMERLSRMPYSEMSESERKYYQARVREKKGIMAIDFDAIMDNPGSEDNILVRHKDSLVVPQKKDYINVQGRVNNPGNVKYVEGYTYLDYIESAGGFGYRADDDETLLAKSKGELFLAEDRNYTIQPGDVILVPPVSERQVWDGVMQALTISSQIVALAGVFLAIFR